MEVIQGTGTSETAVAAGEQFTRAVAGAYYRGAVDEAERCQADGIAGEGDIDVAMRLGCGWSEGPLAWARAKGDPA